MIMAYEIFFTTLLIVMSGLITWFGIYVLYNLFKGQS
jgi:hypothetical protein